MRMVQASGQESPAEAWNLVVVLIWKCRDLVDQFLVLEEVVLLPIDAGMPLLDCLENTNTATLSSKTVQISNNETQIHTSK